MAEPESYLTYERFKRALGITDAIATRLSVARDSNQEQQENNTLSI